MINDPTKPVLQRYACHSQVSAVLPTFGGEWVRFDDVKAKEVVAWRVSYNWGETWTVFQHDPSLQLAGVPGVVIRPLVEGETE